jgi:hypothetical protein
MLDQSHALQFSERRFAVDRLSRAVAASIEAACASSDPFDHLVFEQVFPDDVYAAMLAALPVASDYRPMSGRAKGLDASDGTHTRVKIDLFPEYIRHLPPDKRAVWDVVGQAICSPEVRKAFVRRLAGPLERRFGARFNEMAFYPVPILTRDIPGYRIHPHTDTRWKGITVQFYLPRDASALHVGTIFHQKLADGSLPKKTQMRFAPNSGYAFAVGEETWHSADEVGPEITSRDSILLTYFVDAGAMRYFRNRGKRIGNFLLNEARNRLRLPV